MWLDFITLATVRGEKTSDGYQIVCFLVISFLPQINQYHQLLVCPPNPNVCIQIYIYICTLSPLFLIIYFYFKLFFRIGV